MAVIEGAIKEMALDVGIVLPDVRVTGDDPALPSVFRLGTAAAACVGAATAAAAAHWHQGQEPPPAPTPSGAPDAASGSAAGLGSAAASGSVPGSAPEVAVDVRHAVVAFQSERHFRIDGDKSHLWAPLSGDYRTSDGWVRLHCNFDHHRYAALRALGLPARATGDDAMRACESRTAIEVEEAVTREGGCAAAMRSRTEWLAHPQARAVAGLPLVGVSRLAETSARVRPSHPASPDTASPDTACFAGQMCQRAGGAKDRPLSGVRVLDLTRVIAGPVAARTLAAHGAQVLRVGAAHLPEVPGLVVETAFGKRACHIDLRSEPGALRELVRQADVVIQAYRPGSLRDRGFGPGDLARLRPGIVCVDISAYGSRGPWASRRGFDSLVQMACGIAHENGDGSRPAPLPAQALDHGTGYLAAFGAIAALLRRTVEGGSWHVEVSLARTAKWLDDLGRVDGGGTPQPSTEGLLATMASEYGMLTYVTPPGLVDGARPYWASPPPRQGQHPAAWETAIKTA